MTQPVTHIRSDDSAPRVLIRKLHGVMAMRSSAQVKLERIAEIIAQALRSEVCSIYLIKEGQLELFATHGLKREAVHVTRIGLSEGLVGHVVRNSTVLNLTEARTHPDFLYKPETGEEDFHAFAGVPILYQGDAIGALCVQNLTPADYSKEGMEALQTVAMVLSELVCANKLINPEQLEKERSLAHGPTQQKGLVLVDGLAQGQAVHHQPRVVITHTVAEDIGYEAQRLREGFATLRHQIEQMMNKVEFSQSREHHEILEAYKMFAFDEGWTRRIRKAIDSGLTAEAAVERVQQETRIAMRQSTDPYFLERLHDLEDLSNRLMRILSGSEESAAHHRLPDDVILVAKSLGPAELLEYDRNRLRGVVLEEGSPTSHVTIIARAMGIAMIGQIPDAREMIFEHDLVLIDGRNDFVFVRPIPTIIRRFESNITLYKKKRAAYDRLRDFPAQTRDGVLVELMINAGLLVDLPVLAMTGADGIGLFRTELQFMISDTLPKREAQQDLYSEVFEKAHGRPVTFRTLDIGGDKNLPYLQHTSHEENNPAMGWRALRLALEHEGLLKIQCRALLEAAAKAGRPLNLLFPMVTLTEEYLEAKQIVLELIEWLQQRNKAVPDEIRYGVMLEVPSLAWQLESLLPQVDFLSIGANDLLQFFFAADRGNPKLANRYDWTHPSVLKFLRKIIKTADAAQVPVNLCGEMGGRPLEALALLAIGIRGLSITPAAVGLIKTMIRSVTMSDITAKMDEWLEDNDIDIRSNLIKYAEDHGVELS